MTQLVPPGCLLAPSAVYLAPSATMLAPPSVGGSVFISRILALEPLEFFWGDNIIVDPENDEGGIRAMQWTDLSGNDRHFTQTLGHNQPELLVDGNGKSYLYFNAADGSSGDHLARSPDSGYMGSSLTSQTRVQIANLTTGGTPCLGEAVFSGNVSFPSISMISTTYRAMFGTGANMASPPATTSGQQVWSVVWDSTKPTPAERILMYKNAAAQALTITGTMTAVPPNANALYHTIGARANPSISFAATTREYGLIVFARALNSTELSELHSALQDELGWW